MEDDSSNFESQWTSTVSWRGGAGTWVTQMQMTSVLTPRLHSDVTVDFQMPDLTISDSLRRRRNNSTPRNT